jgi:hypothetical protein
MAVPTSFVMAVPTSFVMAGLDPAIPATAVPAVNYPFLMVRAGRDDRATGLIRQHFTYTTMPNERTTR